MPALQPVDGYVFIGVLFAYFWRWVFGYGFGTRPKKIKLHIGDIK